MSAYLWKKYVGTFLVFAMLHATITQFKQLNVTESKARDRGMRARE